MLTYQELRGKISYLKKEDLAVVDKAHSFSEKAHHGQFRKSGDPFVTHPIAVTAILVDLHVDVASLCAALLHDVIEDTDCTKATIKKHFNLEIANLVDGVTKMTKVENLTEKEKQAENFRKMLLAMTEDIRVMIIKLADRLHNMRTIGSMSAKKVILKSKETLEIYVPIAKRLGMHEMAIELEDISFKSIHPYRYRVLDRALERIQKKRTYLLEEIKRNIFEHMKQMGIDPVAIDTRKKNIYSIYHKMKVKRKSFSEIMDVYAIRIRVNSIDDCYRTLGVVHKLYRPVPNRFKDYIALPKLNHYQSLHTILYGPQNIPIEAQIRTEEMNTLAESGVAAHWMYKISDNDKNVKTDKLLGRKWLERLAEIQKTTRGDSLEFLQNAKMAMFPNEIFVFSPKGEIFELPIYSTAMDFAYAVHTEVGNTCVAAKVDRQLVPLSCQLKNGQTVEIIVSPNTSPSLAWLDIVVTTKARASIRHFFKQQEHNQSRRLGENLLRRALGEVEEDYDQLEQSVLEKMLVAFSIVSLDDLLVDIGLGNRSASVVSRQYISMKNNDQSSDMVDIDQPLIIHGTEGMVVNFSQCCYPIPGDPIIGVLSPGKGLNVHRESCSHVMKLKQKTSHCTAVCWADNITGEFTVKLWAKLANVAGSLAQIAVAIGNQESNIHNIKLHQQDSTYSVIELDIIVFSRAHLSKVLNVTNHLKCIYKISRLKSIVMGYNHTDKHDGAI